LRPGTYNLEPRTKFSSIRISTDRALHKWFLYIATLHHKGTGQSGIKLILDWLLAIQFSKNYM